MAPKRQRTSKGKERATSSSTNLESLLQFHRPSQQAKCDLLKTFEFTPNRYLDMEIAAQFNLADPIMEYIANAGWEKFTAIQFPAYHEPTLEFLSSLWVSDDLETLDQPGTITFRLNGQSFSLSINEFNIHAGFEDEQSIQTPTYRDAYTSFPLIFDDQAFWRSITTQGLIYNPSQSKASSIRNPTLRLLHKFIAHSISGRKDSLGVVSKTDLFYLWCMCTRHQCNIGVWFLVHCQKIGKINRRSNKGYIAVGSYISYMAHRLNALHPDATLTCDHVPIDLRVLESMKMIYQHGGHWVLYGAQNIPEEAEDDEPQPPAPDHPHPTAEQAPASDEVYRRIDQLAVGQEDLRRQMEQMAIDQNETRSHLIRYIHDCFQAAGFHPPPPSM